MENIHNAIAWYQKKIGSYDKQLWEQSVERKLQKGLPNVHHAPRKTVRLKTEYIDVDLIRGSTFTKTKPQVPWIYITRKAIVRVLFFPFYYRWWVLQSSRKVYYILFTLYLLQVITALIYFWNLDGSIIEDELTLTEVVVPLGLMFLLGLIHAQTVLAHFSLKPPRRDGRHGSKKKRQRQGGSVPRDSAADPDASAQPHGSDGSQDGRSAREVSPHRSHRHTTSLWNVPRVEVSAHDSPPSQLSPSAARQNFPQLRAARHSKRGEKKNVRIVDISQKYVAQESGAESSQDMRVKSSSRRRLEKIKMSKLERRSVREEAAAVSSDVNRAEEDVLEETSVVRDSCETVVGAISNADADKSSSGIEDACDSGAACDSEAYQGRTDATDSDSLAGRFELVHLDDRGLRESSGVRDDRGFTNNRGQKEPLQDRGFKEIADEVRSVPVVPIVLKDLVQLEGVVTLPRKDSLSHIATQSRASFSEDGATDHRDDENLSDTGHVSNSSNYNPSDSDAENCDDGDSVGMPVPVTPMASSSTLDGEGGSGNALPSSSSPHTPSSSHNASPRKIAQTSQQLEGESSASDPDTRQSSSGVRRRRRASANQSGTEPTDGGRSRPLPPKLLGLRAQSKVTQTSGVSSSENEAVGLLLGSSNKATISSEEWEDRMQSDVTTSSSYSSSNSESELSENVEHVVEENDDDELAQEGLMPTSPFHGINLLQPPSSSNPSLHSAQPDKVSCMIWERNECKKLDLTALDIGWAIIDKVDNMAESSDYIFIGVALSFCLGCVPLVYRFFSTKGMSPEASTHLLGWFWALGQKNSWGQNLIMVNGFIQRLALSCIFFFLLTVTDRTFKQRLLYAKHFSYLTSSRRARKFDMPHFRLNKVRNIKIWLSLRSYLKRRGPQRSVDVIVSASFYLTISLVCLMCIQMLKDSETYLEYLCNWELVVWCFALGIYIMRFMTLGLKINKKYRNLSVLITEQINLYLQMEQKPHKKEELTLANNVLRLAEDLLKELESPFKISGFSANPLIYNIMKVVVLSAFSAVMTEVLGFKLKLYKIKLK
ncbi:protein PHTF2-like [Littorina saxatilis]|uniref:PHTF1/2 N-terminal domain-containing protein n=1 Tax=Littorina saxatilis TaxID=31220 RepID=A0AAN9AS10_9CAEN